MGRGSHDTGVNTFSGRKNSKKVFTRSHVTLRSGTHNSKGKALSGHKNDQYCPPVVS